VGFLVLGGLGGKFSTASSPYALRMGKDGRAGIRIIIGTRLQRLGVRDVTLSTKKIRPHRRCRYCPIIIMPYYTIIQINSSSLLDSGVVSPGGLVLVLAGANPNPPPLPLCAILMIGSLGFI
jgi:hypothetical protein